MDQYFECVPKPCRVMLIVVIISHIIIIWKTVAFLLDVLGIIEGIWIAKCTDKQTANAKHALDDTENKLSKLRHFNECLHWSATIPNTSR